MEITVLINVNKNIILIGTAHISKESVEEVQEAIKNIHQMLLQLNFVKEDMMQFQRRINGKKHLLPSF